MVLTKEKRLKELHLVVTHPVVGQFVARKITDPELVNDHTYVDRAVNNLERILAKKHSWPDCDPVIFCKRIEEE